MLTSFGVKERHHVAEDNVSKLGLKQMFNIFKRNDQLVASGIATVLFFVGNNQLIYFIMNFCFFEFGYSSGGQMVFLFTVIYAVGTLLSQISFPLITKLAKRQKLLKILSAVLFIFYMLFLSLGYDRGCCDGPV